MHGGMIPEPCCGTLVSARYGAGIVALAPTLPPLGGLEVQARAARAIHRTPFARMLPSVIGAVVTFRGINCAAATAA